MQDDPRDGSLAAANVNAEANAWFDKVGRSCLQNSTCRHRPRTAQRKRFAALLIGGVRHSARASSAALKPDLARAHKKAITPPVGHLAKPPISLPICPPRSPTKGTVSASFPMSRGRVVECQALCLPLCTQQPRVDLSHQHTTALVG
jgi:hypothetical protein